MRVFVRGAAAVFAAAVMSACGGGGPSSPTPVASSSSSTSTTTTTTPPTTTGTATVAYTNDVKAVLDADCVRCHSASVREGGVDVSSYAAVMRIVTAGNANSTLVRATQSGGSMYSYLSGSRATKAALIRSWVVDNNAAQSR